MRRLAVVVALVGSAFVAWWFARDSRPASVAAPEPPATSTEHVGQPAISLPEHEGEPTRIEARGAEPNPTPERVPAPADALPSVAPESAPFYGRVVTAEHGTPIVSARVAPRRRPQVRNATPESDLVVHSDADGLFVWPAGVARAVTLEVARPGFASKFVVFDRSHRRPEDALTIELARSAELVVRVAGPAPSEGDRRVTVSCQLTALRQEDDDSHTYVSATESWELPLESGRAEFVELPPDVPLRVACVAGRREIAVALEPLVLEPGERREFDFGVGRGARLLGIVRSIDGEPLANADVEIASPEDLRDSVRNGRIVRSNESGEFAVALLPVGHWNVALRPRAPADDDPTTQYWSSPVDVDVGPFDEELRVELVAEQRGAVAGRVVDEQGKPVAAALVRVAPLDRHWIDASFLNERAFSADDGGFSFSQIAATRVRLWVDKGPSESVSDFVDAPIGARDVELVVRRSIALELAIVDASGTPCPEGQVTYGRAHAELGSFPSATTSLVGGVPRLDGLTPGEWDIVVTTRDRQLGFARVALVAGEAPLPLRLTAAPSAELRLATRERSVPVVVRVGDVQVAGTNLSRGASERLLVPPGTSTITWRAPSDGVVRERDVTLAAGASHTERLESN